MDNGNIMRISGKMLHVRLLTILGNNITFFLSIAFPISLAHVWKLNLTGIMAAVSLSSQTCLL